MQRHSKQYIEYMKSPEWNERRLARLEKAKYRCERCGEQSRLEVHHKTYEHLGNEPLSDLIALCHSCHWAADEERRGNNEPRQRFEAPIPPKPINRKQAKKIHKKQKPKKEHSDGWGGLGFVKPLWMKKKK